MTEHPLDRLVRDQHAGRHGGLVSVCSAHPLVLDETVRHGARGDAVVLVEATCNQVNQDGGYTGLVPADFRREVEGLAARHGLPPARLVLGGDHLGPSPWQHLPAAAALAKADALVAAFAEAGFTKLHLDASMPLADDPAGPMTPDVAAQRTARLAAVAEAASARVGIEPRYVVGTEVPVPGGESAGEHGVHVSAAADVGETLASTAAEFTAAGVRGAWERVRAVVAQPGVEFSDTELFGYVPGQAAELARLLDEHPSLVYEAHSTDYQTRQALRALVTDRFAVLKVGPALTFAYREAVFGLSFVEDELLGARGSRVREVLDQAMLADPTSWVAFYPDDPVRAARARRYSRSDRSRYYWPVPAVREAVQCMVANLRSTGLPAELVSQFLPVQARRMASGLVDDDPEDLLRDAVGVVLDDYAWATAASPAS